MPAVTTWIGVPLLGGLIGYVTNRIAVKMIFRPIEPVSILGIRVQGLIARRKDELAESIGRVVGDHLVQHDDITKAFENIDFEAAIKGVLNDSLGPKIAEFRALPMIGAFLTDERIEALQGSVLESIVAHKATFLAKMEEAVEQGLDVQAVVTDKIAAFSVEKLESLVLAVAAKELRAIEYFGALLGVLIGVLQVLLITTLS